MVVPPVHKIAVGALPCLLLHGVEAAFVGHGPMARHLSFGIKSRAPADDRSILSKTTIGFSFNEPTSTTCNKEQQRPIATLASWWTAGLISLASVLCVPPPEEAFAFLTKDQVDRVVDGDTIVTRSTGRIRMIGMNTPETVSPKQRVQGEPAQCYGPEASAITKKLLPPGTEVQLEIDKEPQDQYGRNLAYVYRSSDGMFINGQLVKEGYARARSYGANTKYEELLKGYQKEAQAAKRGLWGKCDTSTPTSRSGAVPSQPTNFHKLSNPGDTKNCKDFPSYAEAKAWYDKYLPLYGDIAKLDGNGNGIPCEKLAGAPKKDKAAVNK